MDFHNLHVDLQTPFLEATYKTFLKISDKKVSDGW